MNLSRFLGSRLRCTSAMSLSRHWDRCACRSGGCAPTILFCSEVYICKHRQLGEHSSSLRQPCMVGPFGFPFPSHLPCHSAVLRCSKASSANLHRPTHAYYRAPQQAARLFVEEDEAEHRPAQAPLVRALLKEHQFK